MADDGTSLMIIRAWTEPGSSEPLRARIRCSNDVSAGFETEATFARPEAVVSAVESWLAELLGSVLPVD